MFFNLCFFMAKSVDRSINERIKAICDEVFNGNLTQMAKATYISRTTLISITGEQQSTPGYDILRKIVEMPTVNIDKDWLLTGNGKMIVEDVPTPEISYTDGVPYYDVDFQLGFDEMEHPGAPNPEYLIRMPGYERATLWCNASGHSMEPEINSGDILAMQRIEDFSFLPFGDIYGFITTNGMRTIKRLGRSDRDGHYRLIPTNKDYDAQDIPIKAILVVYRVMGAMKAF